MTKATTKSGGKKSTTKPAVKSASNRSAAKTVAKKTSKAAKAPSKSTTATRSATKATKAAGKLTKATGAKVKSTTSTAKSSKSTKAASKATAKSTTKSTTKNAKRSSQQIDVKVGSLAPKPGSFSLGSRNGNGLSFLNGKPGSSAGADAAGSGEPKLTRTKLTAKELRHFRELLLAKRRQLLGDMDSMESEALRTEGTNLSHLPVHMADMGTDNYEQEFTLSLVDRDRKVIDEIDHALKKIDSKTYGICEGTGQMIAKPRLESVPWTRYGIEYARSLQQPGSRR